VKYTKPPPRTGEVVIIFYGKIMQDDFSLLFDKNPKQDIQYLRFFCEE
jgi:hypothetical protein